MKNTTFIYCLFLTFVITNGYSQTESSLLSIDGKHLKDDCGEKIVLKGINLGSIYDAADFGVSETEEIEQTGANTVRIVIQKNYCTYEPPDFNCTPHVTTSVQITPMIEAALDNNMIPVVELHDYTGSANPLGDLQAAANWWIQPDILNVLLAHQKYLILNLANEPSSANYPPGAGEQTTYYSANINAITLLRNAGLTCPIMIDGMHWGKDHTFFLNHGADLLAADPLHNLIFSVHTYWPQTGNAITVTDEQMTNYINAMGNSNLPFVIGEIAHSEVQNSGTYPINYNLLLDLLDQNEIGYIVWWWGLQNAENNQLAMTTDGMYANLTPEGSAFVNGNTNAIQTAKRPYKMVNGECDILNNGNFNTAQIEVYPNPAVQDITITGSEDIKQIDMYNVMGINVKKVSENFDAISLSNLPCGLYILDFTLLNGEKMQQKVIKQ